jgi:hypothetical protein
LELRPGRLRRVTGGVSRPHIWNGTSSRERRREPIFSAAGFWSVTIYDGATRYTASNPINRYSLGSDDALTKDPDGSFTIYLQHDNPGPDKEANWLPAPAGRSISSCAITRPCLRSLRACRIWRRSTGRRRLRPQAVAIAGAAHLLAFSLVYNYNLNLTERERSRPGRHAGPGAAWRSNQDRPAEGH